MVINEDFLYPPAARPRPVICESPGSKLKHGSAVRLKRGKRGCQRAAINESRRLEVGARLCRAIGGIRVDSRFLESTPHLSYNNRRTHKALNSYKNDFFPEIDSGFFFFQNALKSAFV